MLYEINLTAHKYLHTSPIEPITKHCKCISGICNDPAVFFRTQFQVGCTYCGKNMHAQLPDMTRLAFFPSNKSRLHCELKAETLAHQQPLGYSHTMYGTRNRLQLYCIAALTSVFRTG